MTILARPLMDDPHYTTARHLGQEAFINELNYGKSPTIPFADTVRIDLFMEGYRFEKDEMDSLPPLP